MLSSAVKVMEVSAPLMGPEVMSFPSMRRVAVLKAKAFPCLALKGLEAPGKFNL